MKCKKCGAGPFATLPDVLAHHREVHPRTGAPRDPSGPNVPRVRAGGSSRRRIEDVSGPGAPAGGVGPPEPDADDGRDRPTPTDSDPRRPSRPTVNAPIIRITPEATAQGVSEAVRAALPLDVLAGLIRSVSVAISDADGAGPAGHLSEIQSTQVATLLYDSTVDLVVSRFRGDVTRFKAALAVVLILVMKGRVHGAAIRDRLAERRAAADVARSVEIAAETTGLSPVELAMRRQGTIAVENAQRGLS